MRDGSRLRGRRGNTAIVFAVSLTTFLAFVALTVDLGYARMVQQQLENTSDAAAHAGGLRLDGTDEGMAAARETAIAIAAANPAGGRALTLDANEDNDPDGDIVLGVWDTETDTFEPSDDPAEVDTVQVRARIPDLALFVAPISLGVSSAPVSSRSFAEARTSGAGAVACYIPLAVAECIVDRYTVDGLQDLTLKLNPPGIDNVGWARGNGTPNASWTRSQILDCEQDGEVAIGDPVGLQNGVVTSAMSALATRVTDSTTTWSAERWGTLPTRAVNSSIPAARYGRTYEGPILVFDGGSAYCTGSGGSFNHSKPLVGFLWGAIYDVVNSGSSASRTVKMRVDTSTTYDFGTAPGGPDYGVITRTPPRLVRGR